MLGPVLDDGHTVGTRRTDRISTDRHPAVEGDDRQVQCQARGHESGAWNPPVHPDDREQQRIARDERRGRQSRTFRAPDGDRHPLEHQRDRCEPPPVHPDTFQESRRTAADDPREYRDREDEGNDGHDDASLSRERILAPRSMEVQGTRRSRIQ
jgi:hypothetical protein